MNIILLTRYRYHTSKYIERQVGCFSPLPELLVRRLVYHWVCSTWPVWRQTNSYHPSCRASRRNSLVNVTKLEISRPRPSRPFEGHHNFHSSKQLFTLKKWCQHRCNNCSSFDFAHGSKKVGSFFLKFWGSSKNLADCFRCRREPLCQILQKCSQNFWRILQTDRQIPNILLHEDNCWNCT